MDLVATALAVLECRGLGNLRIRGKCLGSLLFFTIFGLDILIEIISLRRSRAISAQKESPTVFLVFLLLLFLVIVTCWI